MTPLRTPASSSSLLRLGTLAALMLAGSTAEAGDWGEGARITNAASHCASYGPGFVDVGNGTCVRPSNHVRVQLGTRPVASGSWTSGGTSSAAMRSEGPEFMPGVGASHQLRVRNGLQTLSPY